MSTESRGDEFSAGGVVVRGEEMIAIVPLKRSADGGRVLGLPKGHPDGDETPEQAAAREITEETGVTARLIELLGDVEYRYERKGRPVHKVVRFFLFEYECGDVADHDQEIEHAEWLPLRDAAARLTYEGEREIVRRALSQRAADR
ncbi:MAG: NUDIX domain-containing protein [Solirubrobacteraceae bacterium]